MISPTSARFAGSWRIFSIPGEAKLTSDGLVFQSKNTAKLFERSLSLQKLESERSKVSLCPFHCKTRPSAPSLASKGLENIPQVPGNRAEVCENHDVRKAVSATLSFLK